MKKSIKHMSFILPDLSIDVVDMAVHGLFHVAAFVVIETLAMYFFAMLFHAPTVLSERQKMGLVSHLDSGKYPSKNW